MRTEYSESGLFFLPLRCKNRKYYQAKTRKRRRSPRDGPEPGRAAVRARDTNPKNDESARQRQSRGRQQARTDARLPDGQHSAERGRSGTQRSLCRPGPDRRHGATKRSSTSDTGRPSATDRTACSRLTCSISRATCTDKRSKSSYWSFCARNGASDRPKSCPARSKPTRSGARTPPPGLGPLREAVQRNTL